LRATADPSFRASGAGARKDIHPEPLRITAQPLGPTWLALLWDR
jgi:hypothetical protein